MFLEAQATDEQQRRLDEADATIKRARQQEKQAQQRQQQQSQRAQPPDGRTRKGMRRRPVAAGGLRYPSPDEIAAQQAAQQAEKQQATAKKVKQQTKKQLKRTYHPQFLAAAREFRDRFLESASTQQGAGLLAESAGKYECRANCTQAPGCRA